MFIKLSEDDKIEIEIVDRQHQEMIDLINQLHETMISGSQETKIDLFDKFFLVLANHFVNEEELMSEYKFINYYSHKQEHNRMLEKMKIFRSELHKGVTDINLELLKSIRQWFFNHNKLNDSKMGVFLKDQGVY